MKMERTINALGTVAVLSLIVAVVFAVLSIPHPGFAGRVAWYGLAAFSGSLLMGFALAFGSLYGKKTGGG